ncbi:MAG: gliding motility-associated C-terminal domain-containing protein, partial [Bacteroidetes bacterium]
KTTLVQNESLWGGINAIKEVNNEVLLVTQQYYNGIQYCLATNFKSIGLIKLNKVTGTHLSSKYYCLKFSGTGCLSQNDSYLNRVQFLSNGKIVIGGMIYACDKLLFFTIETDHNFSNPQCYSYDYIAPYTLQGQSVGVNQFGEVSLFARGYNGQNFLYATLLPNGNVKMQRKMEMPPGIVLSSGSFSPVFKKPDDFLFYVNQQQNGQQSLRVIEFKGNNAQTSDCTGKDTSFLAGQSHVIVPIPRNWDTIRFETPTIINTNFGISDFSFQREEVCSSISICDSLKIIGRDTICIGDPVQQFTAIRNPGCLKLPKWKIDTSAIRAIQIINDTTVSITFKRSWQGYLYAYSSSCNRLSDSLYIKVIPAVLPVQLGRDTTYCNSVVLDAGDNFASYKWQDGSSGRFFNVDTGGIYYVSAKDFCGNNFSDTIRLSSPPKNIFIGNDTCIQQFPFLISANSGFKNYQWQNGSNNAGYNATVPGLYYVNATNGCNNNYSDSIMINQAVRPFSLGKDTTLCGQQTITLSAPPGYAEYLWQDNSTSNRMVVSDTGYFFVRITDGCNKTFTDTIRINPLNLYFSVGKDTVTICKEETIQLAASTGFTNYLWQPSYNIKDANKREPWVNPGISTKYIATAEKGPGCTVSDTIFVLVKDCPTDFFVPSAFTPNDDRLNDFFGPIATAPLQHYEFRIYDRWGQQVFFSNNIQKKWDGRVKAVKQNAGTFVWQCTYKFFNGPDLSKKGTFVLIR